MVSFAASILNFAMKSNLKHFILIGLILTPSLLWAQYTVNFDGSGETKTGYASGSVTLNGIAWTLNEALIGTTAGSDWFNGTRSMRMRGRNGSVSYMTANKSNGIGTVSFGYKAYGSTADASQQPWAVEYSTDNGSTWTQIGSNFTATGAVQNFSQAVNVTGNIRLRFRLTTTPGATGDRRVNVDDIQITDYTGATPTIAVLPISLSSFLTTSGTASSSQSYALSGSNLTPSANDITVTAPTDYEVSLNNSSFSNSLTVGYTGGTLASTTIYVRIKASASAGSPSGNVSNAGGGATTQNVAVSGTVCPTAGGNFSVGDISILGITSDAPDQFSFVNWVSIPVNAALNFTDNAWTGTALASNEQTLLWQNNTGSAIAPGTVITITDLGTPGTADQGSVISGSLNGISNSDDNIFAYEGTAACPSFVFGISHAAWITSGTANNNNSYLPSTLNVTNGSLTMNSTLDNWEYSAPRNNQATIAAYKAIVNNTANWTGNDTGFSLSSTDFTVASSTPSVELSASAASGSEAATSVITITATASAAVTGNQTVTLTIGGTGITSGDYTVTNSGVITILNGQTVGSLTFTVVDDVLVEGSETASISYSVGGLSSGLGIGTTTSVTIGITDNDGTTLYSQASGGTNSAIWDIIPNGTGQLATAFGGFTEFMDVVIQTGHVVDITVSGPDMKSLTVQSGGKIYANNGASPEYIDIFGNVTNSGTIGNGGTLDLISFNLKGTNPIIFSGNGSYDLGRLKKEAGSSGTVNINSNVNLRFAGAVLYNNNNNSTIDVTIAAGKTVSVLDPIGDVAIDGIDGASANERGGSITVNGTLSIAGKLLALSNNSGSYPCSISIGAAGKIVTKDATVNVTGGFTGFAISTGGRFEINGVLSVTGGTLNSNGGVVINSGATLLHGAGTPSGGGSVSGNVTVKRQGATNGAIYNYWSTPVSGGLIPGYQTFSYDSDMGTQDYGDDQLPDPGWVGFSGAMANGKGYAARGGDLASFIGTANNGTIPFTLDYHPFSPGNTAAGTPFNLVGNPYPGALNAGIFISANSNINGSLYFWNDDLTGGSGYSYTDYAIWNGTGSTGTGAGTTPPNGSIASGQGFLVRATAPGSVNFTNAMRVSGPNNVFLKPNAENSRLWLALEGNDLYNEILIGMMEDATDEEDRLYDAIKLRGNSSVALAAISEGSEYAIMAFPPSTNERIVPLLAHVVSAGTYAFNPHTIEGFDGYDIYLEDRRHSTLTPIQSGSPINVSMSAGENHDRFYLHFAPTNVTSISENESDVQIKALIGSDVVSLISTAGHPMVGSLEVISANGQLLMSRSNLTLSNSPFTISTSQMSAGVHIIRFVSDDQNLVTRFIKN